jgi:hypothetical protein
MAVTSDLQPINGWTPPLIFDQYLGEKRVVTQEDIDELLRIRDAYIAVIKAVRTTHDVSYILKGTR